MRPRPNANAVRYTSSRLRSFPDRDVPDLVSCWSGSNQWLEQERAIVKPAVIVALGATAARSLFDRVVTISKMRGRPHRLADGTTVFVTIHPSFLLRIQDEADKQREYRKFVADLRRASVAAPLDDD
jgi:uracil-DNA glycosylase family 4